MAYRLSECRRSDVDEIAVAWHKPRRTVRVTTAVHCLVTGREVHVVFLFLSEPCPQLMQCG